MKYLVTENMVMWAFRYALGRMTGAVSDVTEQLKEHWNNLEPFTRDQIQREIQTAIDMGDAGYDCDIERWQEILELKK